MKDLLEWDPSVYGEIHTERVRAHEKHNKSGGSMVGALPDDKRWLPILGEEFGEVASCLTYDKDINNLRAELIQVATMCVEWIIAIDYDNEEISTLNYGG